ncbi:hypothetical protein NPIL_476061 [Nephila pilipes]|uniref:Uncharacterized protein n=1 Tax=Nephila pilipes TaxID=299642 RepID=A0A8X6N7F9_NEPPI|nr:hypothetical protein NPIL_476061 [Nephila pilipes]
MNFVLRFTYHNSEENKFGAVIHLASRKKNRENPFENFEPPKIPGTECLKKKTDTERVRIKLEESQTSNASFEAQNNNRRTKTSRRLRLYISRMNSILKFVG